MFYKHTHLLFLSLSLFSNSQILRSNKQIQRQQPCPPPHLPQFSQSQTPPPPPPPPIATPTLGCAGMGCVAKSHWPGSCQRGQVAWPSCAGLGCATQAVVRVYFLIFGFGFPIRSVFFFFFFFFGFCSWVFWDFGSLRKESVRRTGSGSPDT